MSAVQPEPAAAGVADLVRAAMAAALGHQDFDDEDDFFAVGGHSLLVARIMAELGRQFGARLPLRLFFDHPTVADLSGAIVAKGLGPRQDQPAGAS